MGCAASAPLDVQMPTKAPGPVLLKSSSITSTGTAKSVQMRNKRRLYNEHEALLVSAGARFHDFNDTGFRPGDCLLVVDMQNDFLPVADAPDGGRFGVSEGASASEAVVRLIKKAAAAG